MNYKLVILIELEISSHPIGYDFEKIINNMLEIALPFYLADDR